MCIRRFSSGMLSLGGFGSCCMTSTRSVGTTTPSTPTSSPANLRCYFYYTNERGDLYNVYNTADGFFDTIGVVVKGKKDHQQGDTPPPTHPPLTKKQLQSIPSGPSFLKDRAFLDFFMKNLRVFSTDPKVCRDVNRARRYEDCLLASSSSAAPLSSPLSATSTKSNGGDNSEVDVRGDEEDTVGASAAAVTTIKSVLEKEGIDAHDMFPYVSLCGKELNFIACEKVPIVFYDLMAATPTTPKNDEDNNNKVESSDDNNMVLRFAGTLEEPFVPASLVVDEEGYLYHPVTTLNTNPLPRRARQQHTTGDGKYDTTAPTPEVDGDTGDEQQQHRPQLGLVGASVGFKLGFEYICEEKDTDGNYIIEWNGIKTPVPLLQ